MVVREFLKHRIQTDGLDSVIALGMGLILGFTVTEKSVESVVIM